MALKECKECGAEISSSAKACPKCGKKQKHTGLVLLLCIMAIFLGIAVGLSGNVDTTNTTSNSIISSVVTKENYDKIKKGMTEKEVKKILGEPQSISENETPGVGTMILKHYQEALSLKAIDIYFLDGKVYMKNWTEL